MCFLSAWIFTQALSYPILMSCVLVNSHYEDYLSASFPFGSYTQVFIAPEMTVSSWSSGASMSIFSSQLLYDEKLINQVMLMKELPLYTENDLFILCPSCFASVNLS